MPSIKCRGCDKVAAATKPAKEVAKNTKPKSEKTKKA